MLPFFFFSSNNVSADSIKNYVVVFFNSSVLHDVAVVALSQAFVSIQFSIVV